MDSNDDCSNIITFYKKNKLHISNDNCCSWSNIQCVNNKINSFQYIDDVHETIDFSTFPILEDLTDLTIQGKYLLGGSVPYIINAAGSNSIEILNISSNFMTGDVPDMPSNLKELYVDNNQFSSLNFSFSHSPNLEVFSGNSNSFIENDFYILTEFVNMKNISLDNNGLSVIPSSINNLIELDYLSLKDNNISQLPEEFDSIKSLEELNLSGNSYMEGKIKKGTNIVKCYLSQTNICLESGDICNTYDTKNICGQSKSKSVLSNALIKENDKMKDFSLMSKTTKGNSDSFNSDNTELNYPTLRSRTSKEVINSINKAVSHLNPEGDTKIKNAEIAFSNGMKIVGTANEAFNLSENRNQKPQLKEIFKDVDSYDGEITDHLSSNLDNENNQIVNISNNSFTDENHYPSLNRSVISNPCNPSEHIIPNYTSYSLPRNNNVQNILFTNGANSNFLANGNTVMNNAFVNNTQNQQNNAISSNNYNNYFNKYNNLNNNNDSFPSSPTSTTEIQRRPRSRSSLANSSENINNNNMNILRLNARDTVMPGVRKDNANEYTNKINNINSEINSQSQIYKNGILNNVNSFNLEKFNNYNVINNNTGFNNNGQIHVLSPTLVAANNNNQSNPILVALPVLPINTNSLNRNQNKLINFNNTMVRKEPVNNNINQPLNNVFVIKSTQDNIPSLMVNTGYTNTLNPVNPAKQKVSPNRNISLSSNSNSCTDSNITNSLSQSSFSLNNSSFSDDELSKNILFQNPTSVTVHKNNSSIRRGYSNTLKPIFNHQDSINSVGNKSASSGNVSSLDLHMDSVELDELFNEINSSK
ncbi:hypothetical protein PIROE2DRAFT_8743 [Piromyces sp. E2]|nr:hypothetical protein PIROE2DRAFT_8743 [Piromyces sp. E2]|eukprot:OUM64439.1 hypothetical protein PIROE2DRAFT_8743 [Piromyces sp. E2]